MVAKHGVARPQKVVDEPDFFSLILRNEYIVRSLFRDTIIGVPMRAMLSPFTAISPRYQGAPVPSTMRALRNKRSYCAHANDERAPAISIKKHFK